MHIHHPLTKKKARNYMLNEHWIKSPNLLCKRFGWWNTPNLNNNYLYLRVCFGSNCAKCTIYNIYKRSKFQIFFCSIANKQPTAHAIHTKLLLQFPFTPGQE